MSKYISPSALYKLPSGQNVHPCRLIHKDGTLMWKHALLHNGEITIPINEAHEAHIIKTAQRLEELNSWISQDLDPWECLIPINWYVLNDSELNQGISVYFKHSLLDNYQTYHALIPHIQDHELLELKLNQIYFKRC
tara:strand:+ start:5341 stop:5751 length:411 start_codon:yes stop_codon:yes gene_type:complete